MLVVADLHVYIYTHGNDRSNARAGAVAVMHEAKRKGWGPEEVRPFYSFLFCVLYNRSIDCLSCSTLDAWHPPIPPARSSPHI